MALTTFVGQNLGAKQEERTRKGARFGIFVTVILAELIGIVVFVFAPQLIAAFDSSPEIIAFGVGKARTAALFYCLLAFSRFYCGDFEGCRKNYGIDDHYDDVLVCDPGVIPFGDDSVDT